MGLWVEKALMIVLAMHIHQRFTNLFEHPKRNRIAIERDRTSPAGIQTSNQKDFASIRRVEAGQTRRSTKSRTCAS